MPTQKIPAAALGGLLMCLAASFAPAQEEAQQDDPYRAYEGKTDPTERLACYDAVRQRFAGPPREVQPAPAKRPAKAIPAPASAAPRQAPDTIPTEPIAVRTDTPAPTAPASNASAASSATAASTVAYFGLEKGKVKYVDSVVERIANNYAKERTFYLANGQIWEDLWYDRTTFREDDTVRVQRSLSGAYFLKAGKFSTRIRRVK